MTDEVRPDEAAPARDQDSSHSKAFGYQASGVRWDERLIVTPDT
jgi:hypothetical protein